MSKFVLALILALYSAILAAQEAVEEVEPIYPMTPVCRELSGPVKLALHIDKNGNPHNEVWLS